MGSRQTSIPRQWLVADERIGAHLWTALRKLPRQSGVLVLYRAMPKGRRARLLARIRRIARARGLLVIDEANGGAIRVHNSRELLRAGLAKRPLLFLSPIFETRSHPHWAPLERNRLAALLRLSSAPIIALGGMNARRFRRIERLGFCGWAGVDAWSAPKKPQRSRDERPCSCL